MKTYKNEDYSKQLSEGELNLVSDDVGSIVHEEICTDDKQSSLKDFANFHRRNWMEDIENWWKHFLFLWNIKQMRKHMN